MVTVPSCVTFNNFKYIFHIPTEVFHSFLVQSSSLSQSYLTLCNQRARLPLFFAISWSLFKLMSIELVMSSSHLILYSPLLLLPLIFPSTRVFSNESVICIRWPKYWSFSFSISPSNEYSGLISFRMDWLDLLAVQGTGGFMVIDGKTNTIL